MWMLKWLLAALVMRENVLPYIGSHISERLYGMAAIGDAPSSAFVVNATPNALKNSPMKNMKYLFTPSLTVISSIHSLQDTGVPGPRSAGCFASYRQQSAVKRSFCR